MPQHPPTEVTLYLVLQDTDQTTFSMPTEFVAAYADQGKAEKHAERFGPHGAFAVVRAIKFPATVLYDALNIAAEKTTK